jgi:CheY-like chemotaxis protein
VTDELFSLRVLFVSAAPEERELFRRAASASRVPLEVVEANDAPAAVGWLVAGVDIAFLDEALGDEIVGKVVAVARTTVKPSFTVLLSESRTTGPFQTDALATKPSGPAEARELIDKSVRVRKRCSVLIVDDSSTTRSVVRRILEATRFPLEVSEAGRGGEAMDLAQRIEFDLAFVDYNMPGFTGIETMGELRRVRRNPEFVLITSVQDKAIAARTRALGATFLRKPFYLADVEDILCRFYGLRALNPLRS